MRTLHRYLLRETLATLFMTVAVFTFVLLLGNALKEVLGLLVSRQVGLGTLGMALLLLIPYVLVFALPMGMLTASLLVFGRCSADQELTAMRGSGVSLLALIWPLLLLSLFLSVVSAVMNMEIAPRCRMAYKKLLFETGLARASRFLPEKVFIKDFPGRIVYIGKVDGRKLKDVLIYELDDDGKLRGYLRAAEGRVRVDETNNNILTLQVSDAWWVEIGSKTRGMDTMHAGHAEYVYTNQLLQADERLKLNDMTMTQLWAEQRDLEGRLQSPPTQQLSSEQLRAMMREMEKQRAEISLPVKMQIHRQFAFSFACVAFTVVGIPLGIRAHRRETTFGIGVALVLVLLYYSFFILGHVLDAEPQWHPHLILWVPNFLFEAIGAALLWRANRGY